MQYLSIFEVSPRPELARCRGKKQGRLASLHPSPRSEVGSYVMESLESTAECGVCNIRAMPARNWSPVTPIDPLINPRSHSILALSLYSLTQGYDYYSSKQISTDQGLSHHEQNRYSHSIRPQFNKVSTAEGCAPGEIWSRRSTYCLGLGGERHGHYFEICQTDFVLKFPTGRSFKPPHTYESQSCGFERDQDWRYGSD